MEDLTGRQLNAYQIVSALGEGGMAAVYKAYQPSVDRYVALKVLPRYYARDPQFTGRFTQEARVIASLQHPHILPVHDFGEADDYTYLVMPYVQGGTLADLLEDEKPLPLARIRRLLTQIGDALDYAHSRGIIHRDIKPSNVLLDGRGNALLSDFGLAKIVESNVHFTKTGGILGTPIYMSPEQSLGQALDHRTDIYSLGVVLYQMATGRPPYMADTPVALLLKHAHDPLPPPRQIRPELTEALERVILKALAKDPEDRYATVGEFVQALQRAVDVAAQQPVAVAKTITEPPPAAPARTVTPQAPVAPDDGGAPRSPARRRLLPWLLAGAVGLLLLGLLLGGGALVLSSLSGGEDANNDNVASEDVAGEDVAGEDGDVPDGIAPPAAAEIFQQGEVAYEEGDLSAASDLFAEAIALDPDVAYYHCALARLHRDWGGYDDAQDMFERCRELAEEEGDEPLVREVNAELALTDALFAEDSEGDTEAAVAILEEAGQRDGTAPWVHCMRGEIALAGELYEAAVAAFTTCQELVDDEGWQQRAPVGVVQAQYWEAMSREATQTALFHLEQWLELEPDNPEPFCEAGELYLYGVDEVDKAEGAYQRCQELATEPEMEWWAISSLLDIEVTRAREEGDWERAIAAYDQLIAQSEEPETYRFCERAEAYIGLGDLEAARADAEACLNQSSDEEDYSEWARSLLQDIEDMEP